MKEDTKKAQSIAKLKEAKNNFHDPNKFLAVDNDKYYSILYENILDIQDEISTFASESYSGQGLTLNEILRLILGKSYNLILAMGYELYRDFDEYVHNEVFDVCLFQGLCTYIQETNRIQTSTAIQYTYTHSPKQFNQEGVMKDGLDVRNPYYINLAYDKEGNEKREPLTKTSANMRQYKSRLFANRLSPIPGTEWMFMPNASEHEWLQYFEYIEDKSEDGKIFRDTFKRIGNLYNDLYKALKQNDKNGILKPKENYLEDLQIAYTKFQHKLQKIDFENYFLLCEHCLEHVKKDASYYGINLYRLEKEFKPYIITLEMNKLMLCEDEKEFQLLLDISGYLRDIPYLKIYEKIANLKERKIVCRYAAIFSIFIGEVIRTFMLILDRFVEKGFFGKEYERTFLEIINIMAANVLYEPIEYKSRIKKGNHEMPQVAFTCLLTAPVKQNIKMAIEQYVHLEQLKKTNSSE